MDINWTTVLVAAVTSAIISSVNFVCIRYLGRVMDRLEKGYERNRNGEAR